jgi:glycosyltransferase involved in cell wall biosynthesis
MKTVEKEIRDVKLWIIGPNGNLSSYIRKDRVFNYLGARPHLEMPKYHNQAKVFVNPYSSSAIAGCTCALEEALACGTPIVGTKYLDFPFIWKDGEVGYLANEGTPQSLADSIIRALLDGSKMQKNCRKLALREFSHESVGTMYSEVFNQVLDSAR